MRYIAYGSTMNLEQMAFRCPGSKVVCNGLLYGWKLVFNTHADIIPTGNDANVVPVVVWDIAPEDWKMLDRYEGSPKYYVKEEVETVFADGRVENCIAYVMADDRKGYEPPYENYFNIILRGCQENHIDVEYLYDALDDSYANCVMLTF